MGMQASESHSDLSETPIADAPGRGRRWVAIAVFVAALAVVLLLLLLSWHVPDLFPCRTFCAVAIGVAMGAAVRRMIWARGPDTWWLLETSAGMLFLAVVGLTLSLLDVPWR
jgi:hypothetical protein